MRAEADREECKSTIQAKLRERLKEEIRFTSTLRHFEASDEGRDEIRGDDLGKTRLCE